MSRRRSSPPLSGVPSHPRRGDTPVPAVYVTGDTPIAMALRVLTALEGAEKITLELARLEVPGTSTTLVAALGGIRKAQGEMHGLSRRLAGARDGIPDGGGAPPTKRA